MFNEDPKVIHYVGNNISLCRFPYTTLVVILFYRHCCNESGTIAHLKKMSQPGCCVCVGGSTNHGFALICMFQLIHKYNNTVCNILYIYLQTCERPLFFDFNPQNKGLKSTSQQILSKGSRCLVHDSPSWDQ